MDVQQDRNSAGVRNRRFRVGALALLSCTLIAGVLALTVPAVAQTGGDESGNDGDTDHSPEEQNAGEAALAERLHAALEPLVTAGTITSEQRDAIVEALLSARRSATSDGFKLHHGRRWMGPGAGGDPGADLAELLGLSSSDLRARLWAGETLAELAGSVDVAVGAIVDVLVEAAVARIDTAIEVGRLGAEDREACVTALEAHITARVNGDRPDGGSGLSACGGDRESHRSHGGRGAARPKTGSWTPPAAV